MARCMGDLFGKRHRNADGRNIAQTLLVLVLPAGGPPSEFRHGNWGIEACWSGSNDPIGRSGGGGT